MPLFHVQDSDRPLFIIADDMQAAIERWRDVVEYENEGERPDWPEGVHYIADDDEIAVAEPYAPHVRITLKESTTPTEGSTHEQGSAI